MGSLACLSRGTMGDEATPRERDFMDMDDEFENPLGGGGSDEPDNSTSVCSRLVCCLLVFDHPRTRAPASKPLRLRRGVPGGRGRGRPASDGFCRSVAGHRVSGISHLAPDGPGTMLLDGAAAAAKFSARKIPKFAKFDKVSIPKNAFGRSM